MSLGRLLTSGKSLVGLQNDGCRYEMRPKNLLPKFGSDKNPFLTAKPKVESAPAESSRKVSVESRTLKSSEPEVAKLKETKPLPAIKAFKSSEAAPEKPIVKINMLNRLGRWLTKLNPLNWRRGARAEKKSAAITKTPIQAELSLDKIKVLRNDLTEADVEVVPVKISVQPKPQPAAPPAKVAETAELIKT